MPNDSGQRGYGEMLGTPGYLTGKTYTACEWIAQQVEQGADPTGIAFVSFTNAACNEARSRIGQRLGLYDYELEFCATIHALAKRALGIDRKDWLAEGAWLRQFGEEHDYDVVPTRKAATEDLDELTVSGGQDAVLLAVWNFGRARLITDPEAAFETYRRYDPDGEVRVNYPRYLRFVEEYEDAKKLANRLDYTDLLLRLREKPRAVPASVVVVDEAQDMSPLLWSAADILFGGTGGTRPARACLADDDQAIYSFQGATPALFNERAAARRAQLRQSRRLPRKILEHATRVIRQNRNRVDKEFLPVTAAIVEGRSGREPGPARPLELEGHLDRAYGLSQLHLNNGESWFILVRNWAFVSGIVTELENAGIPYRVQGEAYYSPWNERGPLKAAKAVYTLSDGGRIGAADLRALLDKTRVETKEIPGAWTRGAKTKIGALLDGESAPQFSLLDLPHVGLTRWGFDRIALRDMALLEGGISARDMNAYRAAQDRGTWGQEPQVTVSSIHGVKGQEADNVVALRACTLAPARNLEREDRREEEIRLAYVAITRARQRFFVLDQDRGFGQPYDVFSL